MYNKRIYVMILLCVLLMGIFIPSIANAVYDVEISNGSVGPDKFSLGGDPDQRVFYITNRARLIASIIGGFATATMVAAAIYNVTRLNLTMNNPMQRQQCIRGILLCGVMAALLGGTTLYIGLFYRLFQ